MVSDHPQPRKRLGSTAKENLGDARVLLDTAAHNAQAAAKNPDYDEAVEALDRALAMAEQAVIALKRVRSALG